MDQKTLYSTKEYYNNIYIMYSIIEKTANLIHWLKIWSIIGYETFL